MKTTRTTTTIYHADKPAFHEEGIQSMHGFIVLSLLMALSEKPDGASLMAGPIIQVKSGFAFTEGPADDGKLAVLFTDIPNEKIHRVNAFGELSTFSATSGHANGLMVDAKGRVYACEMDGRVVRYDADGSNRTVLAETYNGKRFNAPNDLVLDQVGGIYFTDPMFRAPTPLPQEKTCVYYIDAKGTVTRLIDDLPNPNGVILSPDEKTLYVIPSGQAEMMAYPVEAPGKIGPGRIFVKLAQPEGSTKGGGDGLTVDVDGNVYITSALGIQVFSSDGKPIEVLKFPEQPANVAFAGKDRKTLFVTARTSLYSVPMRVRGHAFPGGD